MDGDAAPLIQRFYSFSLAYRLELPFAFLSSMSFGGGLNMLQEDLFNLRDASAFYWSTDLGVNLGFVNNEKITLKSGLAFQNVTSPQKVASGSADSHNSKFIQYTDWSLYASTWNDRLYFSGTLNLAGERRTYESGLIPRAGGSLKTAVYGIRPIEYLDLSLKYKGDDALWLGLVGIYPLSEQNANVSRLAVQVDLSHDKIDSNVEGRGFVTIFSIRGVFLLW
jgi:hypothetical protein